jgi:dienelactone hydrolase
VRRPRPRRDAARVTNPATAASLAVRVVYAESERPRPGLILVPGALSPGSDYFGATGLTERFARVGYVAVEFDPDGRGDSGGTEDCNGPGQQAGLAAVIAYASGLPMIDAERIVVVSFCYGLAMVAGALDQHPALPVQLVVDWEAPARREQIKRLTPFRDRRIVDPRGEDAWWREREPAERVSRLTVAYQRVQSDPDHAQASLDHALELIRIITATEHGGAGRSRWTRLNGNCPNRVYGDEAEAFFLPAVAAEIAVLPYLLEVVPPDGRFHLP